MPRRIILQATTLATLTGVFGELAAAACVQAQTPKRFHGSLTSDPAIARYENLIRNRFSGEGALNTVAFVEKYFRVVGNAGFNASIARVAAILDSAGYVEQSKAQPGDKLTYRIEHRALKQPTWEPVDASVSIVGQPAPLLRFATNRNMLAINSFSTPAEGVEAELVDVSHFKPGDYAGKSFADKILFTDGSLGQAMLQGVQKGGALGVLGYSMPAYTQPEKYPNSIQFTSMRLDTVHKAWLIKLSYGARAALRTALAQGPVRVRVMTSARSYPSEELTLVADVHGSDQPDERFVMSAHVQEPGANDNASGVGAMAEMARVTAGLVRAGAVAPRRTITFIWGDEVISTKRYITEDTARATGIRWGLSLDMVGEDTRKTGGTFLIEKMPDPSAVWTRGDDHHTEWGGSPLPESRVMPHYFNDFTRDRCLEQAGASDWIVRTNPFEGGSDHTPFLEAGKPAVLFWHFTDVFYHTDADRLENVSPVTMKNVAVCALTSALTLTSASGATARAIINQTATDAIRRLDTEAALSRAAIAANKSRAEQRHIVESWANYYVGALQATKEIEVGGSSPETLSAIDAAVAKVRVSAEGLIPTL
jgi:aminopeptidase YwaD